MTEKRIDRRRRKRIDVSLPVILENATGVTRNASASGVFFWKRGTFMYGESIRFALERKTDSGKILQKCRGVVVRTEPDDSGVGVAARITESTTERVPGQPSGPESPGPAREEPRDIPRPAADAPASANEPVPPDPVLDAPPAITSPAEDAPLSAERIAAPDPAREEPPTIVLPADDAPASAEKTRVPESPREEPPTIVVPVADAPAWAEKTVVLQSIREKPSTMIPPADDAPAPAESMAVPESAYEDAPTIAWPTDETLFSPQKAVTRDTAREDLPSIAWPTDEAFFSPDKTVSLDAARESPRTETQSFDRAPASVDDAESLDFVEGQPGRIAQRRVDALASAIGTIARWSSMLRGMALDACDELQGQEALEWNIPPAADATSARSERVTVCSVDVVGLRPGQSRTPGSRHDLGVSYRDLARLRSAAGFESRRTGGGASVGEESSSAAHGLRIELAVCAPRGSPRDRTGGRALLPGIVVRTTSVPDDRQQAGDVHCYEETWYSEPREAFDAFMKLAGESAILVNLALLNA